MSEGSRTAREEGFQKGFRKGALFMQFIQQGASPRIAHHWVFDDGTVSAGQLQRAEAAVDAAIHASETAHERDARLRHTPGELLAYALDESDDTTDTTRGLSHE